MSSLSYFLLKIWYSVPWTPEVANLWIVICLGLEFFIFCSRTVLGVCSKIFRIAIVVCTLSVKNMNVRHIIIHCCNFCNNQASRKKNILQNFYKYLLLQCSNMLFFLSKDATLWSVWSVIAILLAIKSETFELKLIFLKFEVLLCAIKNVTIACDIWFTPNRHASIKCVCQFEHRSYGCSVRCVSD